jgi:BirA family biotin operon repressor/biotin-[acetyl-CoA-carboxylase] ligase
MAMPRDDLSAAAITDDLGTRHIGRKVIYRSRVTSTMDVARQEARLGAAEGTVVAAGEQTAGRGRIKRVWLSPGGSIALSIILRPKKSCLPYLIMLASVTVARTIEAVTGLSTQLKWPNDVLISGKKVCGILLESDVRRDAVAYAIIGIGINANLQLADFPDIAAIATSLADESGREVSRVDIIRYLLVEIERLYETFPDGEAVYREWQGRLITLGQKVQVKSGKVVHEGMAESVAKDGSLLLRQVNGSLSRIVAGDVTLRES